MRSVWERIVYEAIWLFLMLAIVTAVFGAWAVLSLVDWVVMFMIAIFVALIMLVVRRFQPITNIRRDVFLKILSLPPVFLVVFWVRAHMDNLGQITWVLQGLIISGVVSVLLRPVLPLIGRIPEEKKVWRISVATLVMLLYLALIYIAFWFAKSRTGVG